ncbi:MAG: hypothetical protein A2X57_03045 [Nitrospirae bacterium GWD2_57_8]|nr:MAG: hypothetical protein A2X57_03045 [Nitrospirae bacterium GWD2_57_8]
MIDQSELEKKVEEGIARIEDYLSLGHIYFAEGQYHKLLSLIEKAYSLQLCVIEKARLLFEKGQALSMIGMPAEAAVCYKVSLNLISTERDSESVLDIRGMNYYGLFLLSNRQKSGTQYADKALKAFKRLVEEHPAYDQNAMLYSHIADLHFRLGASDAAIESYKQAIKLSTNNTTRMWFLSGLASIYRDNKDYQKADETFRQALVLAEEKRYLSKLNFEIGLMYFDLNKQKEALAAFAKALEYKEHDPLLKDDRDYLADITWHLGVLEYSTGNYDEAIKHLTRTLQILDKKSGYYCNAYLTIGHSFLGKGLHGKAREYYMKILESPDATAEEKGEARDALNKIGTPLGRA